MKKICCIVFLFALAITAAAQAEIDPTHQYFSPNVDDCYIADENGWITEMKATYEISVKDATLFGAEYFMSYAFLDEIEYVSRIIDAGNYSIEGQWAPYSVARVFLDFRELSPVPSYTDGVIPAMIGAVINPDKADKSVMTNYEKGITSELARGGGEHLFVNEYAKQIPVDGLFFMLYFPKDYNYYDIQRYGYELDYMTQFVLEANESEVAFLDILKSFPTDGQQHISGINTAQFVKDGYSIGVLASEDFVFAVISDADDYAFSDKNSVISFYENVYDKANLRYIAFQ